MKYREEHFFEKDLLICDICLPDFKKVISRGNNNDNRRIIVWFACLHLVPKVKEYLSVVRNAIFVIKNYNTNIYRGSS